MIRKWKRLYLQIALSVLISAGCFTAAGCGRNNPQAPEETVRGFEEQSLGAAENSEKETEKENGETEETGEDAAKEAETEKEPVITAVNGDVPPEEAYLGGAMLQLLDCADGSQNLSCVFQTKDGSVIVIDGGRNTDAPHLIDVVQSMGGRVSAWLITHPHDDHAGALMNILNQDPIPIEIDAVYYSFLDVEYYEKGENLGRVDFLKDLLQSFQNIEPEKLHTPLQQGMEIQVDDVVITVMNEPFACLENTFNNSSVGYRLDVNGKRILFLGDMGWQAGENIRKVCSPEDLKADVVQMSHHGQDGVEKDVYEVIAPEICLWPTPQWLWDNEKDGVAGAGSFKTLIVREWMESLGVKYNLCIKDGDQILK